MRAVTSCIDFTTNRGLESLQEPFDDMVKHRWQRPPHLQLLAVVLLRGTYQVVSKIVSFDFLGPGKTALGLGHRDMSEKHPSPIKNTGSEPMVQLATVKIPDCQLPLARV